MKELKNRLFEALATKLSITPIGNVWKRRIETLNPNQQFVLAAIGCYGKTEKEVADLMGISRNGVAYHFRNIRSNYGNFPPRILALLAAHFGHFDHFESDFMSPSKWPVECKNGCKEIWLHRKPFFSTPRKFSAVDKKTRVIIDVYLSFFAFYEVLSSILLHGKSPDQPLEKARGWALEAINNPTNPAIKKRISVLVLAFYAYMCGAMPFPMMANLRTALSLDQWSESEFSDAVSWIHKNLNEYGNLWHISNFSKTKTKHDDTTP